MSDLLHALYNLLALASVRSCAIAAGWLGGGFVVWRLWFSETTWTRWLGFLAVDVGLALGVLVFLRAPLQWINYIFFELLFLMLSASRALIKISLVIISAILSLIYFISPIDVVPDLLLGLGWIDDALVAWALIMRAVKSEYAVPMPDVSAEDVAGRPAWKIACAVVVATFLTALLRLATG